MVNLAILFFLIVVIFLIWIQLIPTARLRAQPKGRGQDVDTAIVFGFGYELTDKGEIKPGAANEFLLNWTLASYPQLQTIFVQEGTWAAVCKSSDATCKIGNVELLRIHRHDSKIYVDTLNTAFCALQQLQRLKKAKVLLVAHDLQLQRVAWDIEHIARKFYPDCEFVIPLMPQVPYPTNSVHWQTRNEFIYKTVELLIARPRDFLSPVPTMCKAPLL